MPDDDRLALARPHRRKDIPRKRKIGGASLEADLAHALTDGDLRHLVGIDAETPVRPRFARRVIGFIRLDGRLPEPEKSRGRILEERSRRNSRKYRPSLKAGSI